jgi:hypothetical protein
MTLTAASKNGLFSRYVCQARHNLAGQLAWRLWGNLPSIYRLNCVQHASIELSGDRSVPQTTDCLPYAKGGIGRSEDVI